VMVLLDPVDHKGQWVKRESKANGDTEVNKVDPVCKVFLDHPVLRENPVMLETSVFLVKKDPKDKRDHKVPKVRPVYQDHLANPEELDRKENLANEVNPVQQAALVLEALRVISVPVVKMEQLAHRVMQDLLVSLETMVQKVMLDPLVCLVIPVLQENQDDLASTVPRENLVMTAVLVIVVTLDLKEKLVLKVQ